MQLQWAIAAIVPVLAIATNNKGDSNLPAEARDTAVERDYPIANKIHGVASTGRRSAQHTSEFIMGELSRNVAVGAGDDSDIVLPEYDYVISLPDDDVSSDDDDDDDVGKGYKCSVM